MPMIKAPKMPEGVRRTRRQEAVRLRADIQQEGRKRIHLGRLQGGRMRLSLSMGSPSSLLCPQKSPQLEISDLQCSVRPPAAIQPSPNRHSALRSDHSTSRCRGGFQPASHPSMMRPSCSRYRSAALFSGRDGREMLSPWRRISTRHWPEGRLVKIDMDDHSPPLKASCSSGSRRVDMRVACAMFPRSSCAQLRRHTCSRSPVSPKTRRTLNAISDA